MRNFMIAENLLILAAEEDLTLYDIGRILYRVDSDIEAPIEKIIELT